MQLIDLEGTLQEFSDAGITLEVLNLVKSGKEATVYKVVDQTDGQILALKIYKSHEMRSFKQNYSYLAGMHIGSRTMRQAVRKKTKLGRDYIQSTWVDKEYRMLRKLNAIGANVPEVYAHAPNALLFEYLGDQSPAPRLAEISLTADEARKVFETILGNIELFIETGIVHGDLSAFNILWWNEQPYIIDFPQAVDIMKNPNAQQILATDIANICKYFSQYLEIDENSILSKYDKYQELFVIG